MSKAGEGWLLNTELYRAWHRRRWLTSKSLVALLLALCIATVVTSIFGSTGLTALLGGVTLLTLLMFTFGHTYYQEADAAGHLSPELLALIDSVPDGDQQLLWQSMLSTSTGEAFLAQLELPAEQVLSQVLPLADVVAAANVARLEVEDMIAALLTQPQLATLLRQHELQSEDVTFVRWYLAWQRQLRSERRRWWREERLLSFTGLGLSWTSGYTPLMNRLARLPVGNLWDTVTLGREAVADQLVATLARERQSNVLLIGRPGVGRLGLVKELARRLATNSAHPALQGHRVLYIHVGELIGLAGTGDSQLAILARALREMEQAGNVIAVIDGLSSALADGAENTRLDDILVPFFGSTTVRSVVIASTEEYHRHLQHNDELAHYFEVVRVPSADPATTLQALALAAPQLSRQTNVALPYKSLRALVRLTDGILTDTPYPERAFDVLEEALVVAQGNGQSVLTADSVAALVSRKAGVPVQAVGDEERETLLNLQDVMHRRLVNQEQAVQAIHRALVRARATTRARKRPMGTFLFLGPTGVGKTETAKTLAEAYFGSEDRLIRFDMSEFQSDAGPVALLGNAASGSVGRLTSALSKQPFSVVLLDEFEKAHRSVQQLFLQVFDEGRLTDAQGHEVSFRHSLLIATSNAGAEFIRERAGQSGLDETLRNHILENDIFRPELLNRFDGVITFVPLSPEHVREIAGLLLRSLNKRLDAEHGITVQVTDELLDYLVAHGYDPEFGARPMRRLIQDTVEFTVAQRVLRGQTSPGQQLSLSPEQFESATAAHS